MATHDYIISNASGAAVRADLNNALAAIATNNSSATSPSTTYAYQWWADTGSVPPVMKLRDATNSNWITLFQLDGEWSLIPFENGTAAAPSIYFKDSGTDTGLFSPGVDQVGITTGGAVRLTTSTTAFTGTLPWQGQNGTAAAPALSFSGDPNSGVYNVGADDVGISTNGTLRFDVSTTATTSTLPVVHPLGAVGTPSITFTGDLNTGIWSPAADTVAVSTNGTRAITIDSSQRLGLGSTSPLEKFVVSNSGAEGIEVSPGTAANESTIQAYNRSNSTNNLLTLKGSEVRFRTIGVGTSEAARIDSSGRLLVGTTTSRSGWFNIASWGNPSIQVEGTSPLTSGISVTNNSNDDSGAQLLFGKSRSTSVGGVTAVTSNDNLGRISFQGSDGTELVAACTIECNVDATPGANDMPGRLAFFTTANDAASPTERLRITSGGGVIVLDGVFSTSRTNDTPVVVDRLGNDGTLIDLRQASVGEGSISVSGTTVSYNGAHLSRWSQIPGIDPHDKTDRPEILRGTVMSNLDEMCDWIDPESGDAQDNEQLNKTKISDVEGDKNVAGIFQSWDDDDDTWVNDYYLAMTGDFIIRIAEGVTVERGDLLMSAGDGTAKPQDNDAVRSCTIAKVTSTHVSHTYDDGSYCVPCVLMAC